MTNHKATEGPVDFKKARRKRAELADPSKVDRLPPHSVEAEQGVLGCILLDPETCITQCERLFPHGGVFHDARHRAVWEAIAAMRARRATVDVITLQQALRDNGELEGVGGIAYLASLPDAVPSAANLEHYTTIVLEKYILRQLIGACTDAVARAYEHQGEADALLDAVERDLIKLSRERQTCVTEHLDVAALAEMDVASDPDALIGKRQDGSASRFLCRAGSAWLIGPSGIGKSSLGLQFALCMTLAQSFFGIEAMRPLRVTLVQAENDRGDMAEMLQGVRKGLGLDGFEDSRWLEAMGRLRIHRETRATGMAFCRRLRQIVEQDKCDVVIVDPLLAFAGIDVSKQDQCSKFLREGLNPVLMDTGVCLIGLHHTGKPPKDSRGWSSTDWLYAFLGSSELANWARASMIVRRAGDDLFELRLTKREWRAGAKHPDGTPTANVWLKHGEAGIWWRQVEPPEEQEEGPREKKKSKAEMVATMNSASFLSECPAEGESLRGITQRLSSWAKSKHAPEKVSISPSSARSAVDLMLNSGKLESRDDLYFKGPNA